MNLGLFFISSAIQSDDRQTNGFLCDGACVNSPTYPRTHWWPVLKSCLCVWERGETSLMFQMFYFCTTSPNGRWKVVFTITSCLIVKLFLGVPEPSVHTIPFHLLCFLFNAHSWNHLSSLWKLECASHETQWFRKHNYTTFKPTAFFWIPNQLCVSHAVRFFICMLTWFLLCYLLCLYCAIISMYTSFALLSLNAHAFLRHVSE